MMLTQLADVARRTGYAVLELEGWRTRGHGPMVAVETITCHHTGNGGAPGNAPSLGVVRSGRPGLSGPLAHFVLGRDGTIYVVAAGLCYHAGESRALAYTNSHAVGIEAEAVGEPGLRSDWPPAQLDSYARLCAALRAEFHLSVADVRGHKETCSPVGRKTDPSFNMDAFRLRVAAVNLNTKPHLEDDMPTPADLVKALKPELRAAVVDVLTTEDIIPNRPTKAELSADPKAVATKAPVAWFLSNIEQNQDDDRAEVRAHLANLETKLDQLLAKLGDAPAGNPAP